MVWFMIYMIHFLKWVWNTGGSLRCKWCNWPVDTCETAPRFGQGTEDAERKLVARCLNQDPSQSAGARAGRAARATWIRHGRFRRLFHGPSGGLLDLPAEGEAQSNNVQGSTAFWISISSGLHSLSLSLPLSLSLSRCLLSPLIPVVYTPFGYVGWEMPSRFQCRCGRQRSPGLEGKHFAAGTVQAEGQLYSVCALNCRKTAVPVWMRGSNHHHHQQQQQQQQQQQ